MSAPRSSSDGGKGRNMFGRDEFAALLGGPDGLAEVLTRRSHATATTTTMLDVGKGRKGNQKDVSDMTVEETAALLKQQQQHHHSQNHAGSARLRATSHRAREYHKLLEEQLPNQNVLLSTLQQQQQQQQQPSVSSTIQNTSSNGNCTDQIDNDDELRNDARKEPPLRRRRQKAAPVILVELGIPDRPPKRRDDTTSEDDDDRTDDNDDNDHPPPRPTRNDNSSDDDDHSSVDRRRQRVLQKRKQQQQLAVPPVSRVEPMVDDHCLFEPKHTGADVPTTTTTAEVVGDEAPLNSNVLQRPMSVGDDDYHHDTTTTEMQSSSNKLLRPQRNGTFDDDDGTSDSDASTSSSSEDDSEDGIEKPVFVPKHRRTMIQSLKEEAAKLIEIEQEEIELKKRRQRESRALVQETLMNAKLDRTGNTNAEPFMDGITGATNEVPTDNDDDDDDRNIRYEEWEVRELERIILDWEIEVSKARNEEERNQRRRRYAPSGKRHLDDDMEVTSNRPNAKQSASSEVRQQTAYHHRGAFYMDDTEDNDIRQKAMAYGGNSLSTVVLPDHQHRDRTMLPKVMQVKKFGFANQSKYRGLAAEDTTDKNLDILPIVHGKNKSKRFK